MKSPLLCLRSGAAGALTLLLSLFLLAATPAFARGDKDWKPLNPSDLGASAPTVEKDADAEALFWEVTIDDSKVEELSLKHYIRIKVFNERGRDSQGKVELRYGGNQRVKDIAARVVKPDGTIVELKKEDVFERTTVRNSGLKGKAKSFALPGVEPGSIVEYRWRDVYPGATASGMRLPFQRSIPVRSVTYYLKPYTGMHYRPVNMGDARFEKDKDGFYRMSMSDMPAFREEPRMPPEDAVRSWVYIYNSDDKKLDADKYWKDVGKAFYEGFKDLTKPNDEIKAAVAGIIGDAQTDAEKLQRLYDFCRIKIKNTSDDAAGLTPDEREKLKDNKSPGDTFKRAQGTNGDIDMLFAALARAAGFDARVAFSGDNSDFFFDRSFMHYDFLGSSCIAVRVGDGWQFFSPAGTYTPFGMLSWAGEGQDVLIPDGKEPVWVRGLVSGPEKSVERRTGKFTLTEDGTLEGEVKIEYTGHLAYERKEYNDEDSPTEREKTVVEAWKSRLGAEVTDLRIENVNDPIKPFVYNFRVRVPGYATRTGKRLFFQPAFFQKGLAPLFPTTTRHHEVYFHHPWSEEDSIEFVLPEGFELDNAESPGPVSGGDLTKYEPKAGFTEDGRKFVYTRKFYFGKGGDQMLRFPVTSYPTLKGYFDQVNKQDGHTIALRQGAAIGSK